MALNASGQISIGGSTTGQSINLELGLSSNYTSSLNDSSLRSLAGVASGQISLSNFYGKSASGHTLSFITYSTASSTNDILIPATSQTGDIGVLIDRNSTLDSATVIPSGWNSISNLYLSSSGSTRQILSYKILESTDPNSYITGMHGGLIINKIMLIFRSTATPTSCTIASVGEEITSSDPASKTVTSQTLSYVVVGAIGSSGTPSWVSSWYDNSYTNSYVKFGYKIFNSSAADVTMDMTDTGSRNTIQCCAIVPSYS